MLLHSAMGWRCRAVIVNDAVLYDDGTNGDVTAGDGRYTYGFVRANTVPPSARTLCA